MVKLEDKLRWCHAKEINKQRSFALERAKLENEIERGRERERYLISREREQVMNIGVGGGKDKGVGLGCGGELCSRCGGELCSREVPKIGQPTVAK